MNHKNMIQAKDEPKDDDGVMAETPEPESEIGEEAAAQAPKDEKLELEVKPESEGLKLEPTQIALVEAVNFYGEDDGE